MENESFLARGEIANMVLASLRAILEVKRKAPVADVGESTTLIGRQAVLDSLGLVTLLVDLEQRFEELHGWPVTLANERALSQKHSPFRTVQTLTNYICSLQAEKQAHAAA